MPSDHNSRKRSRLPRPLRWFLYVLALLVVFFILAVALVRTAWFQRELHRHIVATLQDLTGGRVEIRALRFQPMKFRLTFYDFILHGTEHAPARPLLSARTVVTGFTPASLIHRRLLLRMLDAQDAELHVYRYPNGTNNLPSPRRVSEKGGPLKDLINLAIGRLRIARTTLFFNDQRFPLDLTARDITIQLSYSIPAHYTGTIASPELILNRAGRALPPINFSTQLYFTDKDIKVNALAWQVARTAGQGSATVHLLPSLEGDALIQANGEVAELARDLGFKELRSGSFKLESQASFRQGGFEAHGRLQAQRLLIHSPSLQPGFVDLVAEFSADRDHVVVPKFAISALGGITEGRADVSLRGSSPKFVISSKVRGLELERALQSVPSARMSWSELRMASRLDGTVDAGWRGSLQDFNSKFDLRFRGESRAGARPLSGFARGNATLACGLTLNLSGAKFQTGHSTLTAEGTLGTRQSNLGFQFTTSDFGEWQPVIQSVSKSSAPLPLVLNSTATFAGSLTGPMSQPTIRGQLSVGQFHYRGRIWDSLQTGVVAGPNLVQLSSGRLAGAGSRLNFDLSVGLANWKPAPQSPVRVVVTAQRTPLEGLRDALNVNYPVSGLVTARFNIQGTLSNLAGSGSVRVDQAKVAGEPLDLVSADIRAAGSMVNIENIQVVKGQGRLTGQAQVNPTTRAFSTQLHGAGFSLAEIRQLSSGRLGATVLRQVQGIANFDLTGQGTPDNVQLQSKLNIRDVGFQGKPLGNFDGQIDWHGQQLQAQGQFRGPGGNFSFSGGARTEGDWPAQLAAQYTDFRADPWLQLLRPSQLDAVITASGSLELTGPLKDPSRLVIRDRTQNLQVSFSDMTWKNDQPIELSLAEQVLTINQFQMRGPSTNFQMEGQVKFREPATISLNAQGTADASLLTLLDPALLATGRFDLKLQATGRPSQPQLYGVVHVNNVSVGYADLPLRLGGLKGDMELKGDRVTITSLRGESGQGSLTLTGYATLSTPHQVDFRADLDQARIEYPIDFTDVLSGSVHLAGTTESALIKGDIAIKQMYVAEDFDLISWIAEVASQASPRALGMSSPSALGSKIRLDVRVASDPEVRLQSHDLSMVATIDMRLRGNLAAPVAFGDIHIESGEALFRGSRYKLTRGDIALTNPFRTEAILDIEAQTRIEHYDVTLNVTGPSDRSKITYRSDPPLPSADVLALLAFGVAPSEQGLTPGSTPPSLSSMGAGALLSQALSSQLSGRVQRLFGISRIRVDPYVPGPGAGAGASRITVEQQVAPHFTLTYTTTTGTSQQRIIQFDWDVSDKAELIGERDQNGVYGVELRLHHRFK